MRRPVLALPREARRDFAAPRGPVCSGVGCVDAFLSLSKRVACVGDVVSRYCLSRMVSVNHDLELVIVVFDGKTRRTEGVEPLWELLARKGFRMHKVSNRPGGLEPEAVLEVCRVARGSGFHAIAVDGEEDMLALPLIECLPDGSALTYGVPGRGMAIIPISRERRVDAWLRRLRLQPATL